VRHAAIVAVPAVRRTRAPKLAGMTLQRLVSSGPRRSVYDTALAAGLAERR